MLQNLADFPPAVPSFAAGKKMHAVRHRMRLGSNPARFALFDIVAGGAD
jgi:hypothetical protein